MFEIKKEDLSEYLIMLIWAVALILSVFFSDASGPLSRLVLSVIISSCSFITGYLYMRSVKKDEKPQMPGS